MNAQCASSESVLAGALLQFLESSDEVDAQLRDALAQALQNTGSLVRPRLVLQVMESLSFEPRSGFLIAVAVEYFHTASLILDDLPCMDDAGTRRGQPCTHIHYGEDTAILSALALINKAYALIWTSLADLPRDRSLRAANYLDRCLGIAGVIGGQALDLHFDEPTEAAVTRVAMGKTVAMIRLALVFPALVGGASDAVLGELEGLAESWGLAYQAIDDLSDAFLSEDVLGKTSQRDQALQRPSLVNAIGFQATTLRVQAFLAQATNHQITLIATCASWRFLTGVHSKLEASFQQACAARVA